MRIIIFLFLLCSLFAQAQPPALEGTATVRAIQGNSDFSPTLNDLADFFREQNVTTVRLTGQTAAVENVASVTLGSEDATYIVSGNILVTTSGSEAFSLIVDYTDEGNTARTATIPLIRISNGGILAATISAAGAVPYPAVPMYIRCKASTTIAVRTTGTFTGCTYNVEASIARNTTGSPAPAPSENVWNRAVLASPVVNNNSSANTIEDVTGLSFSVTSGKKYAFRAIIQYTVPATQTGSRWSINGPSATVTYASRYSLAATTQTLNSALNAYDLPAASNTTSGNVAGNIAYLDGYIDASASGTVTVRFASEVANSAVTAVAGSFIEWIEVL